MNIHEKTALAPFHPHVPVQKPPSTKPVPLTRAQWREIVVEIIG